MASSMPIPLPPRTPTPPPDDGPQPGPSHRNAGLGLTSLDDTLTENGKPYSHSNLLSPMENTFSSRYGSVPSSTTISPTETNTFYSPMDSRSLYSPMSNGSGSEAATPASGSENFRNPFNFQTVQYSAGSRPVNKSVVGQRRGHKYKHSSVSHQIFLEPAPKPALQIAASLPVPTREELWRSISKEQKWRGVWCLCHLLIAVYVHWSAHGQMTVTALSHLLFFDAAGAIICAGVDVLGNFEVYSMSSIRHPFGLQRSEVICSFGISIMLVFMGFDLISHNLRHMLENLGKHEAHHPHTHRASAGSIDFDALLAIGATLASAVVVKNHRRIGRALRFAPLLSLPSILSNPAHFLTLSCSVLVVLLQLLPKDIYTVVDRVLSMAIGIFMLLLGYRLVKTLGGMLLQSYSGPNLSDVIMDIETDPAVSKVEEASFWQVHFGLCMANLKLRVKGEEQALARLRDRISSSVRNRLAGGYGGGMGVKWEVSTEMILDKD